jgi:hypothetical protein
MKDKMHLVGRMQYGRAVGAYKTTGDNCFFFPLCPTSVIIKNTTFRKLGLFPSSSERVGDTYFVGSGD